MPMKLILLDLKTATKKQLAYRARLIGILKACRWNVTWAARRAQLSRVSMYRRFKILSITIPESAKKKRGRDIFTHKLPPVNRPYVGTLFPDR